MREDFMAMIVRLGAREIKEVHGVNHARIAHEFRVDTVDRPLEGGKAYELGLHDALRSPSRPKACGVHAKHVRPSSGGDSAVQVRARHPPPAHRPPTQTRR